ncbi:MAG TPA: YbaB/EbfC family nucleoid-associated protein [Myxococcota bacterium]|nr:YbaB/EbfC family nucleoid-associated protein [Myxococcota bacterium]
MSDAKLDLGAMMAKAQELTEKLRRAQEELRHRTVSATVGGGLVEVTANGALELVGVRIDPQAVDPRDVVMLQDLVRAAANQALTRAKELAQQTLQQASGLPFPLGPLGGGA